jgi:hypothetical protein
MIYSRHKLLNGSKQWSYQFRKKERKKKNDGKQSNNSEASGLFQETITSCELMSASKAWINKQTIVEKHLVRNTNRNTN